MWSEKPLLHGLRVFEFSLALLDFDFSYSLALRKHSVALAGKAVFVFGLRSEGETVLVFADLREREFFLDLLELAAAPPLGGLVIGSRDNFFRAVGFLVHDLVHGVNSFGFDPTSGGPVRTGTEEIDLYGVGDSGGEFADENCLELRGGLLDDLEVAEDSSVESLPLVRESEGGDPLGAHDLDVAARHARELFDSAGEENELGGADRADELREVGRNGFHLILDKFLDFLLALIEANHYIAGAENSLPLRGAEFLTDGGGGGDFDCDELVGGEEVLKVGLLEVSLFIDEFDAAHVVYGVYDYRL